MWRPRRLTPEQLEERRLQAGRLLRAGHLSQTQIAHRLGVSRMAVSHWAKQLADNPQGLAALRRRPKPGRPSRLSAQQWQDLLHVLARGATLAGLATGRRTPPRLRALIQPRFRP